VVLCGLWLGAFILGVVGHDLMFVGLGGFVWAVVGAKNLCYI
jgi:hypothetical protein